MTWCEAGRRSGDGGRSTTLALVQQLREAVPPEQHWVLVADRGFPSAALFGQLLAHQKIVRRSMR